MINWWAAATVPIWLGSAVTEFSRGNILLGIISCCFAIANACLAVIGGN